MSKLLNNLKEWVSHDLISQQQAQHIQTYEFNKPKSFLALSSILMLGAIVIGIGVISLVAANWDKLTNVIKLICDFLSLFLTAVAVLHSWNIKKYKQFEVLLFLFMGFCLASIGLIAQVYHIGAQAHQVFLLWSVITIGIPFLAKQLLIPLFWVGGFLFGIVFSIIDFEFLRVTPYELIVMLTIPLFCCSIAFTLDSIIQHTKLASAFCLWLFISGCIALIYSETVSLVHITSLSLTDYLKWVALPIIFSIIIIISILKNSHYQNKQKALLLSALFVFLIEFFMPLFCTSDFQLAHRSSLKFMHACLTIILLSLFAVFSMSINRPRLFQTFLCLIGLRFLILYFEALGGLAITGIGLISAGGLIIIMTALWKKYHSFQIPLSFWINKSRS